MKEYIQDKFQVPGTRLSTRGPFLESPDRQRTRKAVVVYMQERGFNSFASNVIKLSDNETKWCSLLARTRALIPYISIGIFDCGPEKLPGLSRNRPQAPVVQTLDSAIHRMNHYPADKYY